MLKIFAYYFLPFVVITVATAIVFLAYYLIRRAHNRIMNDEKQSDEKV